MHGQVGVEVVAEDSLAAAIIDEPPEIGQDFFPPEILDLLPQTGRGLPDIAGEEECL